MNRCKVCHTEFQSSDPDDRICPACDVYLEDQITEASTSYEDWRAAGESIAERRG